MRTPADGWENLMLLAGSPDKVLLVEFKNDKLKPLTGKTHQIRAHLSLYGVPIVGDKIYNDLNIFREYVLNGLNDAMLERLKLPRMALHATSLAFRHPRTQERVTFTSQCPPFALQVLP